MNILISEDDEEIREVMAFMLSEEGATVHTASDGLQALKILTTGDIQFDVLVTDFNMPHMNGDELIKELLSQNIKLKKIIIISGRHENSDDINALAKAHSHISFLFKPVGPDDVLQAVFGR